MLLVGTESVAASPNEPNRIFVTNFKTYTAGQPIAFIKVDHVSNSADDDRLEEMIFTY